VEAGSQKSEFLLFRSFKPTKTYGKWRKGDSHPRING
jgi:hypothetical protein